MDRPTDCHCHSDGATAMIFSCTIYTEMVQDSCLFTYSSETDLLIVEVQCDHVTNTVFKHRYATFSGHSASHRLLQHAIISPQITSFCLTLLFYMCKPQAISNETSTPHLFVPSCSCKTTGQNKQSQIISLHRTKC